MSYLIAAAIMIALTVAIYKLVERNLAEREVARNYRKVFLEAAHKLVANENFPKDRAELLISLAGSRPGWITRTMMFLMLKRAFVGRPASGMGSQWLKRLPQETHTTFAVAVIAFSLADSYHCALLGRFFRAAYPWLDELTRAPETTDVNAQATSRVVYEVIHHAPRQMEQSEPVAALA